MKLYLDMYKASTSFSAGKTTKKEEQAVASDAESYVESPSGVASPGGASYDDPKVGKKWTHGEDEKLDDEIELARQKRNTKAQERNLAPKKEEVSIKKAFDTDAMDMVKSLTSGLKERLQAPSVTDTEYEFLTVVKGYSDLDIRRGRAIITGKDRRLFSDFLCNRLLKSLDGLQKD